ncbi:unnamed protein product [Oikopleura dioica]|uniref:Anion exchange protein n=1 Tax=Oikopleura dioica TaxID=34765 RepID=E4XZK2_OIKDI|nr:unnamed protein product [Oikopleura dioica]
MAITIQVNLLWGSIIPTRKIDSIIDNSMAIIIDKTRQHRLNRKTGDKIDDSRGIQIEPAIPPTISEEVGEGILTQADRDDIQSHRLDDVPGIRRHIITKTLNRKVKLNKVAPVNPVSSGPSTRRNSAIDSEAGKAVPIPTHHEVFVELDELVVGKDNELQWKEKARWIKFEEDVEENEVWSEPVIGSLTFQSLWEVRKGIEKGVCLLDLEAISLPQIAAKVVNAMMNEDLIRESDSIPVMNALLLKHSQNYIKENYKDWSHIFTDLIRPQEFDEDTPVPKNIYDNLYDSVNVEHKKIQLERPPRLTKKLPKIMSKIASNAEGTSVLVGKVGFLKQPVMAFVRLREAIDLGDALSLPIPVRFVLILLGPEDKMDYHEVGRSISTLMSNEVFHDAAYEAKSKTDLLKCIRVFLDDSIVLPPGQIENKCLLKSIEKIQAGVIKRKRIIKFKKELEEKGETLNPLSRTNKFWGAMINDIKRRYPLYLSDIKDGFNAHCIVSALFVYFALLSPAVSFGGLLEDKTNGFLGVSETVIGSAAGGMFCSLFLGQPLLIVGITGPNVVFEEALYNLCERNEYNFLALRWWVGFWMLLITWSFTAFECSFFISYFTRFTEEIFSILISLIFIVESFKKLAKIYKNYPVENVNEYLDRKESLSGDASCDSFDGFYPNTAFLFTLLLFGTFLLAFLLRSFRGSNFLSSSIRRRIGDFGVPIAIIVVVCAQLGSTVYSPKLTVPDAFKDGIVPTDRALRVEYGGNLLGGWLINPMGTNDHPIHGVEIGIALPFAILCYILIFVESQLAEMIISGPDRKLKKGVSYHLDIFVVGTMNGLLSVFGCPWLCAASVRTLTHVNALTITGGFDGAKLAPGEEPIIIGAYEQRISGFISSLLLFGTMLLGRILKEVPTAVLFGIFLYMGVVSLFGVQIIDRIVLFFMPSKYHPEYRYIRIVRPLRVHLFTLIQVVLIGVLWGIKSSPVSIAFPFFLVLCVPIRNYLLPKIFTKKELHELDNETLGIFHP